MIWRYDLILSLDTHSDKVGVITIEDLWRSSTYAALENERRFSLGSGWHTYHNSEFHFLILGGLRVSRTLVIKGRTWGSMFCAKWMSDWDKRIFGRTFDKPHKYKPASWQKLVLAAKTFLYRQSKPGQVLQHNHKVRKADVHTGTPFPPSRPKVLWHHYLRDDLGTPKCHICHDTTASYLSLRKEHILLEFKDMSACKICMRYKKDVSILMRRRPEASWLLGSPFFGDESRIFDNHLGDPA